MNRFCFLTVVVGRQVGRNKRSAVPAVPGISGNSLPELRGACSGLQETVPAYETHSRFQRSRFLPGGVFNMPRSASARATAFASNPAQTSVRHTSGNT